MVFFFRIVKILDDFYEAPRDGFTAVLKRNTTASSREGQIETNPSRLAGARISHGATDEGSFAVRVEGTSLRGFGQDIGVRYSRSQFCRSGIP